MVCRRARLHRLRIIAVVATVTVHAAFTGHNCADKFRVIDYVWMWSI